MVQLVLPRLGWQFNDKCRLDPGHTVEYMGMIIDSGEFVIRAPESKVESARTLVRKMLWLARRRGELPVKMLQQATGRLMSMVLAFAGVRVWTRAMYRQVAMAEMTGERWVAVAG